MSAQAIPSPRLQNTPPRSTVGSPIGGVSMGGFAERSTWRGCTPAGPFSLAPLPLPPALGRVRPRLAVAREAGPAGSLSDVERGGPRPRGPPHRLPQHADHARGRGARPHPLQAGQDPGLVLHGPRERGRPSVGVATAIRGQRTWARRSTATWACTSRAGSSRGGSSPITWPARTGRPGAGTGTSTWPTRTPRDDRDGLATCRRCCRSRLVPRSPSGSARRAGSRSAGSARAPPRAATRTRR